VDSSVFGTWVEAQESYDGALEPNLREGSGVNAYGTAASPGELGISVSQPVETTTRELTVSYEDLGGENVKVTVIGTDVRGNPTHYNWTGKFDGSDYPVVGDINSDTRSYKKISSHKFEVTIKKDGKVTTCGNIVLSFRGNKCIATTTGTIPRGAFKIIATYHKQ
jgi:hypothetical protein